MNEISKTGFATPPGKVELYSKTLEESWLQPLPYYESGRTNRGTSLKNVYWPARR